MIISQVVGWNAKTWKPANLLKTDAHPTLSQELCEVKARIFMESLSMQMDIKYVYIYTYHYYYCYHYCYYYCYYYYLLLYIYVYHYISKLPHTCNVYIYSCCTSMHTNPTCGRSNNSKRFGASKAADQVTHMWGQQIRRHHTPGSGHGKRWEKDGTPYVKHITHLCFWATLFLGTNPPLFLGQTSCSTCCHAPKYSSSCNTPKSFTAKLTSSHKEGLCRPSKNMVAQENWWFIVHRGLSSCSPWNHGIPCTSMYHYPIFRHPQLCIAQSWACSRKPGGTGAVCMAWRSMRSMLLYSCPTRDTPFPIHRLAGWLGICLKIDFKKNNNIRII